MVTLFSYAASSSNQRIFSSVRLGDIESDFREQYEGYSLRQVCISSATWAAVCAFEMQMEDGHVIIGVAKEKQKAEKEHLKTI